jgi:predicted RNA-binding protein with PIN domain
MAYILIDGYNLIGIGHNDLEKARGDIIEKLMRYSQIKKHDITIVFDAWKAGQAVESRTKTGRVTVIFSRIAEKADDVIIRMLGKDDRAWIVISSDREIADFAVRRNLAAIASDEFERKLYQALKEESAEYADTCYDDDEEPPSHAYTKGNPRKLSKKEKRRLQALKKL